MHNFDETRWGNGIYDDLRSQTDQNTRIIGDFTKMVRTVPIIEGMYDTILNDRDWKMHIKMIIADSPFPELNQLDPPHPKMVKAFKQLANEAPSFRRQTLQTRFFETGDNFYLGMEFTREYDDFKNKLASDLVLGLTKKKTLTDLQKRALGRLKYTLGHTIDRLWNEAGLETIRQGDVYNPGARGNVPRLYLINSYFDVDLGSLPVFESFRLSLDPTEKYEIIMKTPFEVIARNVEGFITRMKKTEKVKREGNLTRGPDGNAESKVVSTDYIGLHHSMRLQQTNYLIILQALATFLSVTM
jgi:hypothetical protein